MMSPLITIIFAITVSAIGLGGSGGLQIAFEPPEQISFHAQFIFATEQGERLMAEILRFLSKP